MPGCGRAPSQSSPASPRLRSSCDAAPLRCLWSMLRGLASAIKHEATARRSAPGGGCAVACAAVSATATAAGAPVGRKHTCPVLFVTWGSGGQPAGCRPSEARLGVEPVLRGGGVHGDRTPVRGQGKVGPTVQPRLWGHPLVVPVPAPFQPSPAPCSLQGPCLSTVDAVGEPSSCLGTVGTANKVTDWIMFPVSPGHFPGL